MPQPTEHPESPEPRSGDSAVIDLLRLRDTQGIGELAEALGVTATAVRQRLERLMKGGLVERSTIAKPRGRPAHAYRLTEAGRKLGGDNFRDLAMVLWREIRSVRDPAVRSGLMSRIGSALAETYRLQVTGSGAAARLESVAAMPLAASRVMTTAEIGSRSGAVGFMAAGRRQDRLRGTPSAPSPRPRQLPAGEIRA
jgi:predicted ArsR family transcriptional regulator